MSVQPTNTRPDTLTVGDFETLRIRIDELDRLWHPEARVPVEVPGAVGGAPPDSEIVDLGDALTAALGALATAHRRLQGAGMGLDLGSDPVSLELHGELTDFHPASGRIRIRVRPASSETEHKPTVSKETPHAAITR